MLITLPKSEAQQYQIVWHGAWHRNFDWTPPPGPALPDYSGLREQPRRPRSATTQEDIEAALSEHPCSVVSLAQRLDLSLHVVEKRLRKLVRLGRAVRATAGSTGGRPTYLYVRAR